MSRDIEIYGEVETSLKAYKQVMQVLGMWAKLHSEGRMDIERDHRAGKLRIYFHDSYGVLAWHVGHEVWKLARRYPRQTQGEFSIYTVKAGEAHFARFRASNGGLYRRTLTKKEDEVVPYTLRSPEGREVITEMITKAELRKIQRKKREASRRQRRKSKR